MHLGLAEYAEYPTVPGQHKKPTLLRRSWVAHGGTRDVNDGAISAYMYIYNIYFKTSISSVHLDPFSNFFSGKQCFDRALADIQKLPLGLSM